jgi:hypothetical protein
MLFERVQQSQRPESTTPQTTALPVVQRQTSGDIVSQQNEKTVRLYSSSNLRSRVVDGPGMAVNQLAAFRKDLESTGRKLAELLQQQSAVQNMLK